MPGVPPLRGAVYTTEISLVSQADTDVFQAAPTLAPGDVLVIKDGVLDGNIDTLPTAIVGATKSLLVTLSAAEMTADRVTVQFSDVAGNEWQDASLTIDIDTAQMNDLAKPGDAMDLVAGAMDAAALAADASAEIADAVLDELLAGHTIAGSVGAALLLIGAGSVVTVSPVATDGDLNLYGADDYFSADSRALDWTDSSAAWPDLTGASVMIYVRAPDGTKFNAAGSVVVPVGPPKKVRVELTSAQTTTLLSFPTPSAFRVRATLVGGHKVTLIDGVMVVAEDIA